MSLVVLSALLAAAASVATAQITNPTQTFPATPLASKHFSYPSGVPYQADQDDLIRGRQTGYNQCNSTTEGPNSLCQTAFINHLDDWCVWAPPEPNSTIGDTEGVEVAWCTKPGRGTRLIPQGAILGVQFLRSPSYLEVIAYFNQELINIAPSDFGGELDPHGADTRGNPLGGLVFSNNLPMSGVGDNNTWTQVMEWHNFIGANQSCFKACDPKDPNAKNYCQHIYDRIGVQYTCPNSAQLGVFEMCDSENQDFPGVYVQNGVTMTYSQPPESLGPIQTMPYVARVPSSSNCVTFASADLFGQLPTPSVTPGATLSGSGSASGSPSGAPKPTSSASSGSGASPSKTSGAGGVAQTNTSGATALAGSMLSTAAGVVFAVAFFA